MVRESAISPLIAQPGAHKDGHGPLRVGALVTPNWGPSLYNGQTTRATQHANPPYAQMWLSTSMILRMLSGSISEEVTRFSTARTTPSRVQMPSAVLPNLIASMAYSTWNSRPSGENILTPLHRSG